MSYRCQNCDAQQPPCTPSYRVPVSFRPVNYPSRPEAHRFRRNGITITKDDPGGRGVEVAAELVLCPHCYVTEVSSGK